MTTKEAFEIISMASGLALLSREDHIKVINALNVIEPLTKDTIQK
jgi:hypothetical protein